LKITTSTVNWGSTALTTTYVSSRQLIATVTSTSIATGGTGWITVSSPGVPQSNVAYLPVASSVSTIHTTTFSATVGSNPFQVAEGDFNGDGKLDVVVSNYSGTTISVLLGHGDGTFATQVTYSVGSSPFGIAVADLNGDGKLDLVVGHNNLAGPSVLLGNGDGTFQAATALSTVAEPINLVVADIDGDGKLDIVTTSYGGQSLYFYKGNGDGTFQTAVAVGSSLSNPYHIAVGDFNGDGKLDLAATSEASTNSLHILLGNGDGTFQAAVNSTPIALAWGISAADLNNDGKLDLMVSGLGSPGGIVALLGNSDGTFQSPRTIASSGGYTGITSGDLSADGNVDVIGSNGSVVNAFLGNGDGTFQSAQSLGSNSGIYGMVLGNFATNGGFGVAVGNGTSLQVFLQTITVSPSSFNFGSIGVGSASAAHTFTITNATANTAHITGISFTGTNAGDFSETDTCLTSALASNATCTVSVTFTPGANGARSTTLSLADDAPGSPHTASLTGTGTAAPIVQLSNASLSFGNQNDGTTSNSQSVTVTNNGNASLTSIVVSVTGTNSSEFAQTNNCGGTLTQGSNCSISVTFSPSTAGSKTASVQIADNAGNSPQSISVSGTGVALIPVASLSGGSISFGNQSLGTTSSQQSVTLTNTGNASLIGITIGVGGTNAGDFAETTTCGSALAASANCSIGVTFTPGATGARSASVSIGDNASNSPQSVTLSGAGIQTPAALSYTQAAPSPLVAGSAIGTIAVGVYDSHAAVVTGSSASIQVTITGPNSFSSSQTQSAVSGIATFNFSSVNLTADGAYTLTATSAGLTPAVSTTNVTALLTSLQMVVTGYPSPSYANVVHEFTVSVTDSFGNVITAYTGTVTVTISDPGGVVSPSPYTFTGADQGTHTFGANLFTPGTQSISATDGTLSGSEPGILVNPRPQIVVNTLPDDGGTAACDGTVPCSLRSAVNKANTLTAGDIIVDTTQLSGTAPWTSVLTNGVLELTANVNITGPGAGQFSVSGNNTTSVFQVDGSSVASISALTVTAGNSNTNGGGISNAGGLTISEIAVKNSASSQNGGGIYNTGGLAFNFSTVSGNTASSNGGGIANTGNLTLYQNTLSGNTAAGNGGAVDNSGPLYVTEDTLSGNTASDGSAIENETTGTVTMAQSTVAANTATNQNGGTVSNQNSNPATVTITNSIVAGNTAPGGDCAGCGTQNSSNIFDASLATLKLGPLADNGGSMKTMMPTTGSPAIGAGSVALALDAEFSTPLTDDQRGVDYVRVINNSVDLGAVQSNSGAASALAITLPTSLVAGASQSVTVSALTPAGNPAATYAGTVHFTSSDPAPQLPADYTFASADNGSHVFAVTLDTTGSQSVTVADIGSQSLQASQTVVVGPGGDFTVAAVTGSGQSAVVSAAFSKALSARVIDAFGNNVSGATVVFAAPGSGASGTFAGGGSAASAQTGTSGVATAPAFTANSSTGQYNVTASVQGVLAPASFSLSNTIKPDYSITANPSTLTIQAGKSGTATFTVTPVGGYSATIQFTCSGLPTGATCVFQPAQAVLDGSNTAVTVQLTIHTTGGDGVLSSVLPAGRAGRPAGLMLAGLLLPVGLIILTLMGGRRPVHRHLRPSLAALVLTVACLPTVGLLGCGSTAKPASTPSPSASPLATPAGQYSINVTAGVSGGSNNHSASLAVTVTP
jgi:FG-GAP-like repeat/Abnormal spindle-like microcephaly-assoc'd, ASPM-SPD-2-Hydin